MSCSCSPSALSCFPQPSAACLCFPPHSSLAVCCPPSLPSRERQGQRGEATASMDVWAADPAPNPLTHPLRPFYTEQPALWTLPPALGNSQKHLQSNQGKGKKVSCTDSHCTETDLLCPIVQALWNKKVKNHNRNSKCRSQWCPLQPRAAVSISHHGKRWDKLPNLPGSGWMLADKWHRGWEERCDCIHSTKLCHYGFSPFPFVSKAKKCSLRSYTDRPVQCRAWQSPLGTHTAFGKDDRTLQGHCSVQGDGEGDTSPLWQQDWP